MAGLAEMGLAGVLILKNTAARVYARCGGDCRGLGLRGCPGLQHCGSCLLNEAGAAPLARMATGDYRVGIALVTRSARVKVRSESGSVLSGHPCVLMPTMRLVALNDGRVFIVETSAVTRAPLVYSVLRTQL